MRILIIGGTNFIGPSLVEHLIGAGHQVALFHRGRTQADPHATVEHIHGDRHRLPEYQAEFRRFAPRVVVDMIAYTEQDALSLVETFRGLAERTVVASSADVYRAYGRFTGLEPGQVEATPLNEDAPLRTVLFPHRAQADGPDDLFYWYDKIPVERVAMSEPGLPATILRLPMTYGPRDPYHRLLPYLKRMDDSRKAIAIDEVTAGWKSPRGFVENVARAIALAATTAPAEGRIYNVAESASFSEAQWIRELGDVVGWTGDVVRVPKGRIPVPYHAEQDIAVDAGLIRRELGEFDLVAPADALRLTIDWERANPTPAPPGLGLATDYETEDQLLAELGHGAGGPEVRQ